MVVGWPVPLLAGGGGGWGVGAVVEQPIPLVVAKQKTTYIHMTFVWPRDVSETASPSVGGGPVVRQTIPLVAKQTPTYIHMTKRR